MTNEEFNTLFRERTKRYAVRILKFIDDLPFSTTTKIISY
jgi:hypothetical protein